MDTSNTILQGSGGVQPGTANLQQQNTSSTYQQTGGLQQDVLGPESYRSFDSLTVQGEKPQNEPAVTMGKGSSDVFIGVFFVLILCAIVVFRHYKKTYPKLAAESPIIHEDILQPETVVHERAHSAKKKKNNPIKVKPKKKSAAKAKKRKK